MTRQQLLEQLFTQARRFRLTPIVDNDFPAIRDAFDELLQELEHSPKDDPYTFYLLKSKQDAYAFMQRAVYHVSMMGFRAIIPQLIIDITNGKCPACSAEMQHGKLNPPSPQEPIQGLICPLCRIFVPLPTPQIVIPCPTCSAPMAKEPSGNRCVLCSPLSATNKTQTNGTSTPTKPN